MDIVAKCVRNEVVSYYCPIVYGSIAHNIGKKDARGTHQWTLYVRGSNDGDISRFVSRVIFTLHPSFSIPVREIQTPPFEVSEYGWGEFEASIRIYFKDENESFIDLYKDVKLNAPANTLNILKKPIVSEVYDEIIFDSPSEIFRQCITEYLETFIHSNDTDIISSTSKKKTSSSFSSDHLSDTKDVLILSNISSHLQSEIKKMEGRLLNIEDEITKTKSALD